MLKKSQKLFFILILAASTCLFSQRKQFIYDYSFKMDSLNRDKVENEMMILETSPEGSKFYSYVKFIADSTMNATFAKAKLTKQNSFDFTGIKNAKIKTFVSKKYPEYSSLTRTFVGTTPVTLENSKKMVWEMHPEKDNIFGYQVQKATTNFNGRKWIAWFTNEIPIQDGPYRFFGLPGLIVKLEDSKGDHVYTLIGTKSINDDTEHNLNLTKKNMEIIVTEEKFNKIWNDYKKNPAASIPLQTQGYSVSATMTFDGKTISNEELNKQIEKERKEKIQKENNFIELSLYR